MAWIYLLLAGACEVGATTLFRYTEGLTRIAPTAAFFGLSLVSFYLLFQALEDVPLGTAYAIWTGIGAAGSLLVGIMVYNEPTSAPQLILLTILIGSIVGLKFLSPH